jgi:hypothetical protein
MKVIRNDDDTVSVNFPSLGKAYAIMRSAIEDLSGLEKFSEKAGQDSTLEKLLAISKEIVREMEYLME